MDGKDIPLWIENLGDKELRDLHWEIFQRCIEDDWKNPQNDELCELLCREIQIRMSAQ